MSTATKKMNIFSILFGSGIDVDEYDYSNVQLPDELEKVKKSIEVKENKVKEGFNSSAKGGFAKKINPKTEEAMRAMHNKVANKESKPVDREIGE